MDGQPSAEEPPTTTGFRARFARAWPWLRWPVFAGTALFGLGVLAFAWLWATTDLPEAGALGESAVLLDRNGEELAVLGRDGLRIEVPLEEMAPTLPEAAVAAEDRRFYDHDGVDPVGIARAMWNNVTDDDLEGGSTITQQLVKNAYLTSDRTVTRKAREAVLALKLERTVDKDDIMERYLNEVYFGRGAYGVEAAAKLYFGTTAAELTPGQSALLVGMLRSPEALDPAEAPDAAAERRNQVIDAMVDTGALTAAEGEAARAEPIEAIEEPASTTLAAGVAPHFVEQVRAEIVERFGEQVLYGRGLVVHTTLDLEDQRAAEEAVATNLDDPADPQAAVIGVERNGAVRAWVGGKDFDALQVDLVAADGAGTGRQPGSTFKPVVLATHFERGLGAEMRFPAPPEITLDVGAEPWTVQNAGGQGYGELTVRQATVSSVNTVYAQMLTQFGPQPVADMAQRLGVTRELDAQPSIALGTEEVSPLELATVYSTFARSGERIDPYRITKVEVRDGDVLWELDEPDGEQVVDEGVADTVSAVLADTPRRGTARRAALDRPMAAKTGTTQRNADAWLAGYTPEYTAIVWVGNPDGNTPMDTVDGERVQGGSIPAQIWHDFMVKALADVEPTPFPEPDQDLLTGLGPGADESTTSSTESTTTSSTTTSTTEPGHADEDEEDERTTTTRRPTTTTSTTSTTAPPPSTTSTTVAGGAAGVTSTSAPT